MHSSPPFLKIMRQTAIFFHPQTRTPSLSLPIPIPTLHTYVCTHRSHTYRPYVQYTGGVSAEHRRSLERACQYRYQFLLKNACGMDTHVGVQRIRACTHPPLRSYYVLVPCCQQNERKIIILYIMYNIIIYNNIIIILYIYIFYIIIIYYIHKSDIDSLTHLQIH